MRPLAAVLLVWLILGQIAAGQREPAAEDPRQSVYAAAVELYRNGQRARAAELLEKAIAGAEAGRVGAAHYALLGWCRLGLSDLAAARDAFESAARLEPASAEARSGLGYVALREDALDEARAAFSRAVELSAGDAEAWKGLGIALRRAGQLSEALSALERAVALSVTDGEARELLRETREWTAVTSERRPRPAKSRETPLRYDVRASRRVLEVRGGEGWSPLFVKGVNLGTALPGKWPTEFPDDPALYGRWFEQMSELGVNVVRLYTLHPPSLYRALGEHNRSRPDRKLWLIQGVWAVLPPEDDFDEPAYFAALQEEIRRVIDAVHGNLELPRRPGHAHGVYDTDVSADLLVWLLGREWEPFAVDAYQELRPERNRFEGRYVRAAAAQPMEAWLASICETAAAHESEYYRRQHPIGFVSWPTLDPLHHPTESTIEEEFRMKGEQPASERVHDEDRVGVDATRLEATEDLPAGLFVSYHVYPYYPDFMILDPGYGRARDDGGVGRYFAYLEELRRHHGDQPLLVAEFGVPTSRGISHLHPEKLHHGGHTGVEQGEINARMLREIHGAGLAGGIVFSWIDEWFKHNWAVYDREAPPERNRLWLNVMDPEQSFGLIAAWPGEQGWKVALDGRDGDWAAVEPLYPPSGDGRRPLREFRVTSDEAYLYLYLGLEADDRPVDWTRNAFWIAIDTYDAERGDHRLPEPANLETPIGNEFLLRFEGPRQSRILVDRPYRIFEGASLRPYRSEPNRDGAYAEIIAEPNRERWARDGTHYPSETYSRSPLRHGTTDPASPDYDSLADWIAAPDGRFIEARIPWGLLNVADPSSHQVIHEQTRREGVVETTTTPGFRFHVVALQSKKNKQSRLRPVDTFPRSSDPTEADYPTYTWQGWEQPTYHLTPKSSFEILKRQLAALP